MELFLIKIYCKYRKIYLYRNWKTTEKMRNITTKWIRGEKWETMEAGSTSNFCFIYTDPRSVKFFLHVNMTFSPTFLFNDLLETGVNYIASTRSKFDAKSNQININLSFVFRRNVAFYEILSLGSYGQNCNWLCHGYGLYWSGGLNLDCHTLWPTTPFLYWTIRHLKISKLSIKVICVLGLKWPVKVYLEKF